MIRFTLVATFAFSSLLMSPAQATLVDLGNGTVRDTTTGLFWLKDWNLNSFHDWQTQNDWAEALTIGGRSNWRLPEISELHALASRFRAEPSYINLHTSLRLHFDNVQDNIYWSASSIPTEPNRAFDWFVNDGSELREKSSEVFAVAVSSAQSVPEPTSTALLAGRSQERTATPKRVSLLVGHEALEIAQCHHA